MLEPPIPLDETARLLSLHSMRILDTQAEHRFDRITRMAPRLFGTKTCLISLVDSDRQWFKSAQGLDACETSREVSFCGHAILDDELFIIEDAARDSRFADNPLVAGEPFIRFYAGCPIHGPNKHRIGTLCLIDSEPRSFSADEQDTLRDLAAMVEDELKSSAQTTVDDLTGIANRRGFNLVAKHMLSLCQRTDANAELLFFDLDGFKQVNDVFGHKAGDSALQHFAGLLAKCFRSADVIARIGGDEFAVLLTATAFHSDKKVARLKEMARNESTEPSKKLAWSVGRIGYDPSRHQTIEDMLADADSRMYRDKARKQKMGNRGTGAQSV